MTFKSYIPSRYNTLFFILGLLLWIFTSLKYVFLFGLVYLIIYFVLRRDTNYFRDDPMIMTGVIYAPANGVVVHVEENVNHSFFGEGLTEIQIRIPWWKEMGVFLPISAEVKDLRIFKGKSFFRFGCYAQKAGIANYSGLGMILDTKVTHVGLSLVRCPLGLWPEVSVMPGDRGSRRVNFGFLPFGGTLLLYLPKKYEILVKKNDATQAKETILAVLPE